MEIEIKSFIDMDAINAPHTATVDSEINYIIVRLGQYESVWHVQVLYNIFSLYNFFRK